MVSFPEEIKQHFSGFGISSAVVRLVDGQEEPKLPGYRKVYWSVALPIPETDRNVEGLLLAVAQLEQEDRYINVTDFLRFSPTLQIPARALRRSPSSSSTESETLPHANCRGRAPRLATHLTPSISLATV